MHQHVQIHGTACGDLGGVPNQIYRTETIVLIEVMMMKMELMLQLPINSVFVCFTVKRYTCCSYVVLLTKQLLKEFLL